jgi:DNA-binding response OmpR family regulator
VRVLLVEDSERLRRSIGTALKKSGYAVDTTGDGREGLWLAESNDYDAIVLDIMLPGLDGLSLLQRLRDQGRTAHVLLLTAKDTVQDRVQGLQRGADDYLVKPFALDELLARVQALCRRTYGSKQPRLVIADLEIDTVAKEVFRAGRLVNLKPREYLLLEYLARRSGEVVTRSDIEGHIYNDRVDPMSNVVDSAISSLRKKISGPNADALIHTRHGLGYVLKAP